MKRLLCKIIGCNNSICAEAEWHGDMLLQFFKCSRCGTISPLCGWIRKEWFDDGRIPIERLEKGCVK